jgi:hypothetical protein
VDDTQPAPMTPWRGVGSEGSIDRYAGQSGEGDGVSPTCMVVAWPKTVAVVVRVERPIDGDAGHHNDCGGGGVGRQPSEAVPQSGR